MQVELVACFAEDSLDVVGKVCEDIAGAFPPIAPSVGKPTSVGMNQSANEQARGEVYEFLLPIAECDSAFVLFARSVLGNKHGQDFEYAWTST